MQQDSHGDLENECGHGKVTEQIGEQSWNFVICHGILPILPLNKYDLFFVLILRHLVLYQ